VTPLQHLLAMPPLHLPVTLPLLLVTLLHLLVTLLHLLVTLQLLQATPLLPRLLPTPPSNPRQTQLQTS
jgi:hypothetical protein